MVARVVAARAQGGAQSGARKVDVVSRPLATARELSSLAVYARTVSIEKARRASATDMVPIAEERRPEKGTTSGERPHCGHAWRRARR